MVAMLSVNGYDIISKYLDYDVLVTTTMEQERQLPFPAVTLCNANGFKTDTLARLLQAKSRKKRSTGL